MRRLMSVVPQAVVRLSALRAVIALSATALAMFALPATAQTPSPYKQVTVAELRRDPTAMDGAKVEALGIVLPAGTPAASTLALMTESRDKQAVTVNTARLSPQQLADVVAKCGGGCRAKVRGTYSRGVIQADSLTAP